MSLISFDEVQDGTGIDAADVNNPLNTIYNDYNGNIDSNNLADNAVTTAKITDANVTTAKIKDANVTSAKLAEAFLRGRFQANTTNSAPTGMTIQMGWGYIAGDNSTDLAEAITFPAAFSAAPLVFCADCGARPTSAGTPDGVGWFTTVVSAVLTSRTSAVSTTGFTIKMDRASTNFDAANNYGYMWIAIGTVA